MEVQVLGDAAALAAWLSQRGDVGELRAARDVIVFDFSREGEARAALLREMVLAGFAVVRFAARSLSLEEVFMQVTQGKLQ
jgi:ABC-2 type transport system ATP-binding protein